MAIRSEDLHLSIPNASPIFSKLAISTQFKVSLDLVRRSLSGDDLGLFEYLSNCGVFTETTSTSQKYDFLCSNASLPGSNFNISEELGSRQGMTERFASRRIYNEFDLTFYIDNDYNVLRMFEEYMNYINPVYNESNGRYDGAEGSQLNAYQERNTYSRFRYPDDYRRKISITKFERDFLQNPNDRNNTFKNMPLLTYHFIDAFPVNIADVAMSYQDSTFLQVTVTFTYLRHTVEKHGNAQQSVREKLLNSNQLTQVNPLRPRSLGKELSASTSNPIPDVPVGYVSGQPYYGPFHEHMGVKMVGERHSPYPHAIIYDTLEESMPGSTKTTVTAIDQQQEQDQQQGQEQEQQQEQEQEQQQNQQSYSTQPTNVSVTSGATDPTPTLIGVANPNSTINLIQRISGSNVGSQLIGTSNTSSDGTFTITSSSSLPNGTYILTVENIYGSSSVTHTINVPSSGGGGSSYSGGSSYNY